MYSRDDIISIHAPREGGDGADVVPPTNMAISIHAPREGGDVKLVRYGVVDLYISIHAPREGGDVKFTVRAPEIIYFNPRPPRGGRRKGESYDLS